MVIMNFQRKLSKSSSDIVAMAGMEYINLETFKDFDTKHQQNEKLFCTSSLGKAEKDKIVTAKDVVQTNQAEETTNTYLGQDRLVLKQVIEVYNIHGNNFKAGVHGHVIVDKVDTLNRQGCCHEHNHTTDEIIKLSDNKDETVIDIESLPLNATDSYIQTEQPSTEVQSVIGDLNPNINCPVISHTTNSRTATPAMQVIKSTVKWILLVLIVVLVALCLFVLLYIYIATQASEQSSQSSPQLTTEQQHTAMLGSKTVFYTAVTPISTNKTKTEQSILNIKTTILKQTTSPQDKG